MPNYSYGSTLQARVKRLLEDILGYVDGDFTDLELNDFTWRWQQEDSDRPELVIETTISSLIFLTQKDNYSGKLSKGQINPILTHYLKDFLAILSDNRTVTQGSENWKFTLKLWYKDKAMNLVQFSQEWDSCHTEKSHQVSSQSPITEKSTEIHLTQCLVPQIRQKIYSYIKAKCGTMRILDMTQPITIDDIYTNVYILEKLTAARRLEVSELLANIQIEKQQEFDRFGLGKRLKEERIKGLEAVSIYPKLMIFGKPGAGKTTFLKYLAIKCIEKKILGDYVPIFITLKDFAESTEELSLTDYINSIIKEPEILHKLLEAGKVLILLDGLDEVLEADSRRVIRQIKLLTEHFSKNRILITCRIAAKSYTFEQFTEVEIADFDDKQISTFVKNWFKNNNKKAKLFWEKANNNPPIKELANNPLLLTLLCLIFEEKKKFKDNRSELYSEGVELLLEKWDDKRDIERDEIYKSLSPKRRQDLLGKLAFETFEQGNYFFKCRDAEHNIKDYISNLPNIESHSENLTLDSKKILCSIQAQHGLLVERAVSIFSFSHLTFHEYFVAREIILNSKLENLVIHFTEKRWREVFLLTAGMMRNADELLRMMKLQIDNMLSKDEQLHQYLRWIRNSSTQYLDWFLALELTNFNHQEIIDDSRFKKTIELGDIDYIGDELMWKASDYSWEIIHSLEKSLDLDIDFEESHTFLKDFAYYIAENFILDNALKTTINYISDGNFSFADNFSILGYSHSEIAFEAQSEIVTNYYGDNLFTITRSYLQKMFIDDRLLNNCYIVDDYHIDKIHLFPIFKRIIDNSNIWNDITSTIEYDKDVCYNADDFIEVIKMLLIALTEYCLDKLKEETANNIDTFKSIFNLKIIDEKLDKIFDEYWTEYFHKDILTEILEDFADENILTEIYNKYDENNQNRFLMWWEKESDSWIEKLRNNFISELNIGYDLNFNENQRKILQQYIDANILLINCLNSDCYISKELRENIERSLLLVTSKL